MDTLFYGNAINLVGVLFLALSNAAIAFRSEVASGFRLAAVGGMLVALGSLLLGSYPVVILNVLWMMIGLVGTKHIQMPSFAVHPNVVGVLTTLIGATLAAFGNLTAAAYATTVLYLLGFFLYATKSISRFSYLCWSVAGYVILIPHLIEMRSYSVLLNETVGAIICSAGLVKITLSLNGPAVSGWFSYRNPRVRHHKSRRFISRLF